MIFDDFSQILVGAGRGAVQRYEHIYFLDRSRCPLSDFERIWRGLGDSGVNCLKVQLQTKGHVPGASLLDGACRPAGAVRAEQKSRKLKKCTVVTAASV